MCTTDGDCPPDTSTSTTATAPLRKQVIATLRPSGEKRMSSVRPRAEIASVTHGGPVASIS